jgi:hypothetical protein
MPTPELLMNKDKRKFYCILFGAIAFAVGLGVVIYYANRNLPDDSGGGVLIDEDFLWNIDAKQRNLGNRTTGESTLIFSTVVNSKK